MEKHPADGKGIWATACFHCAIPCVAVAAPAMVNPCSMSKLATAIAPRTPTPRCGTSLRDVLANADPLNRL
ncbi:MAG: hypothetical protein ACLP62_09225 [Acidimicrobiales bacterium]